MKFIQIKNLITSLNERFNHKFLPIAEREHLFSDCTGYAYANIHREFMKGRITLIG